MSVRDSVLTLRAPRAVDRDRVRAMVEATGVFRPNEVDVALEVFDDAMAAPGIDYHLLGAYDDDRLVGFTAFGPTPCTVSTWDLYWIVVDPQVHRLGVGRRLMAASEEAIAQHEGALVVVETSSRDDYEPTRAFYEALGYHRAARIASYYAAGDDLIVFTKPLAPPPAGTAHDG